MHISFKPLLLFSFLFILTSCGQEEKLESANYTEEGFEAFSADSLSANIQSFSHDSMQGRKPFTEGETKSLAWLQQKFAAVGMEPGNGNSYFQDVPMVNIATTADSVMEVRSAQGSFNLKGFDDYVIWTEKTDSIIRLNGDELVFAGYGVYAPERGWNDYEGLDVKGKIVLVLVNDPGYGTGNSLFKGDTMTYYGRWTYKFEEAARQGAKGCLVIHETKAASYPFSVSQNNWNGSRLRLDDRGKNVPYCDVVGWVSTPAARRLLQAAGQDSTLLTKAAQKGFKAKPLGLKLTTSMTVSATYNTTKNVIGKITGAKFPDEYIVYTAHWDHIGIGKPDDKGDSIYNGALDNASGTAGLIELARAFKSMKTKPDRTIVFLAVTAEEQGLWGSAYYAQNPVYPTRQTLANINMDGLNYYGATTDLSIIGQGQSSLEDSLRVATEKLGRNIEFEQSPAAGYYYRSDHFNFAKVGIPALYIKSGVQVTGKEAGFGKKKNEEYREKHYHRPSDEYDASWNLQGAVEDLKLLFMVGKMVANGTARPAWKEGSEFKNVQRSF
jgi:Zn-dependent M28 family amino/carboxypeptidase